jgi:hypothetical protein
MKRKLKRKQKELGLLADHAQGRTKEKDREKGKETEMETGKMQDDQQLASTSRADPSRAGTENGATLPQERASPLQVAPQQALVSRIEISRPADKNAKQREMSEVIRQRQDSEPRWVDPQPIPSLEESGTKMVLKFAKTREKGKGKETKGGLCFNVSCDGC